MINFSPVPSWLPALVQPQDWFIVKICGILLVILFVAGVGSFLKGGGSNV
jgi:hypothetical protein